MLLAVGASASGAAPPAAPATALEQRACEQAFRTLAKEMGSSERPSARYIEECVGANRELKATYGMGEEQYRSWLTCKADSPTAFGGPCDKVLGELLAKKTGDTMDAMMAEDKRREKAALASLASFRRKGLIGAATMKAIETASRDGRHASLSDLFEDALQVLTAGRVRPGTELAIYPHEALISEAKPPFGKGERAADLAFVDARTGRRVVRFSRLTYVTLRLRLQNGEVANSLAWVGEKSDARNIEVAIETTADYGAHLLLDEDTMAGVAKLGKRLSPSLRGVPLLVQGTTSVSYDQWLALAATFRARGLDKNDADPRTLARMVTLADLVKVLR